MASRKEAIGSRVIRFRGLKLKRLQVA